MKENTKAKNCKYRIVKCGQCFLVDKRCYTFFRNKPYWKREKYLTTYFKFEYDKEFNSIEEAEEYINDEKTKNDTYVVKYL